MKRRRFIKYLSIAGISLFLVFIVAGLWMLKEYGKFNSDDPQVWQKEIEAFKKEDLKLKHPKDAVLFVGSSSIRFWNSLSEDMNPIPLIQRGFGGSKIGDGVYWLLKLYSTTM